ncbi:hypothetical protein IHN63_00505 [Deinococcus sp. 6YEL10]|uniref:hypothetical protein n=1 Tax=Deinococcus sp. 6YEL10 TaxID=2745870 RepID=UPI001E5D790E|nr:hypothetical protein [Deinococcus sp. 6YEL10]MCD0159780.1 hypothetical protein [Deinococcus sp. 6YEL10]
MNRLNFDARKLPLVTKKLEDGLFHNPNGTGEARFTIPSAMLPTVDVRLDDPVYINDAVGWCRDFRITKPLYGDFREVSRAIQNDFSGRETQSRRTALILARLGTPIGYETTEQKRIDPLTVSKTLSQRAFNQIDEALGKLSDAELLRDKLPEGASFWNTVEVGKPMSYHADILDSGEGVQEDRMGRYVADLVKFPQNGNFSTSPAMMASLTMRDFQTLVKGISEASELAFPFSNEAN